jgi:hypothetical protein
MVSVTFIMLDVVKLNVIMLTVLAPKRGIIRESVISYLFKKGTNVTNSVTN